MSHFVCTVCRNARLAYADGQLRCSRCGAQFPVVGQIPVLIPVAQQKGKFEHEGKQFSIERLQSIYDRAYEHDDLMGTDLDASYDRTTKELLLRFIGGLEGKRILDVGTGIGKLWKYVEEDVEGHGLDLSLTGVARAKRQHPQVTFSVSTAEVLPYADGFFDAVVSADTIEHTIAPEEALLEVNRVLAPGGILAASFPIPDSLRKWGWNQLRYEGMNLRMLASLLRVLAKRTMLFGRPDFQPIDRDLEANEWVSMVERSGFRVAEVLEWPVRPRLPIVTLVKATKS